MAFVLLLAGIAPSLAAPNPASKVEPLPTLQGKAALNHLQQTGLYGSLAAVVAQDTKLAADDGAAGDMFGVAVAISGDTVVVGSANDGDAGNGSGAAYVFVRSGTGWSQQQKLTADDASAGDSFGSSVAISGDTAVIGAEGTNTGLAYVFVRSGTSWSQQQKLIADDADAVGVSVAISDNKQKLTGNDTQSGDLFGISVAYSSVAGQAGASSRSLLPAMPRPATPSVLRWRSAVRRP